MSLINDALKKAQDQRAQTPLPATHVVAPVRYETATQPPARSRNRHPWAIGGGAVALVVLSVSATILFLHPDSAEPGSKNVTAPPRTETLSPPLVNVPPPQLAVTPVAIEVPQPVNPTQPVSAETHEPDAAAAATSSSATPDTPSVSLPVVVADPTPVRTVAQTQPPAIATPAPVMTAADPAASSSRIQGFIDRLRVTGIRLSDTGNRVILNDRLFHQHELIDHGLGLRLVKIEPGILTFVEVSTGRTYIKLF